MTPPKVCLAVVTLPGDTPSGEVAIVPPYAALLELALLAALLATVDDASVAGDAAGGTAGGGV